MQSSGEGSAAGPSKTGVPKAPSRDRLDPPGWEFGAADDDFVAPQRKKQSPGAETIAVMQRKVWELGKSPLG